MNTTSWSNSEAKVAKWRSVGEVLERSVGEKCWRSVGEKCWREVLEKCWRPPGRSVVREDTVSESEFLGRAWSAWGSCGCDVKHYHCQTPQLLTVS